MESPGNELGCFGRQAESPDRLEFILDDIRTCSERNRTSSPDPRSQHANRKRALERLVAIVAAREHELRDRRRAVRRAAHEGFARGNPVRTWGSSMARVATRPGCTMTRRSTVQARAVASSVVRFGRRGSEAG